MATNDAPSASDATRANDVMRRLLQSLVDAGVERGLQLVAYLDGRRVVDVSVGFADVARTRPVDAATLFPVFSVSKGLAATVIHRLVERGVLSYEMPLADVWPAFDKEGKGDILLRHVLDHSAGMEAVPLGLDRRALLDWDATCRAIAAWRPTSRPGEVRAYHAVTQGFILGEVARRVTGLSFGALVRTELAEPLGGAELFIGLPDALQDRVAELSDASAGPAPADDGVPRAVPNWMHPLHEWMNKAEAYRACVPASNGIATAGALARHYAALLPGGIDGVELLSPERVRLATTRAAATSAGPSPWGLGYRLGDAASPLGVGGFGHDGHGGSIAFADPTRMLAVGFAKNELAVTSASTTPRVMQALREVLGVA